MNSAVVIEELGSVELVQCQASDLGVVNAARVSFGQQSDKMSQADIGLIDFLMRNRHGSPFEHNLFSFKIVCPIFVAREWFRHRISSFNEMSGRYTELPDEMWLPDYKSFRTQVGKPGSYSFEPIDTTTADAARSIIEHLYRESRIAYQTLLALGVAKEVARIVLPLGQQTQFIYTVNARSLMNFLSLRNEATAQREIRLFAEVIEDLAYEHMPVTFESFISNGRTAP